jgi:uncharacterized membrane-anchored protein YjiN (DUF445 family)
MGDAGLPAMSSRSGNAGVPADDPRVVGLRRMRILATLLLVAMTAVFIGTFFLDQGPAWVGYVRAFAEAGMVGACADWFAVVALFRHPLGIPIPHTAIVPHNKARIAGAMGRFISNNFLTPKVLSERLAEIDAARWASDWLAEENNARRIGRMIGRAVPEIVRALPREPIAAVLGESVQTGLAAMPAGPVAANLLSIVWAQGQTQKLIEYTLEQLEATVVENKDAIREKIDANSSRWIPRFVDNMMADKVLNAVTLTLSDMRDPNHHWRLELKAAIEALIQRLQSDPEMQGRAEAVKHELLANPLFHDQIHALWQEIEARLPGNATIYADKIQSVVATALAGSGRWLQEDPALKDRINRWMRYLIKRTIAPRRGEIGSFVTRVVENWDATTLVERMELQVGKDLQYIRINGTLVGGLVGVIIYTVSRWLLPGG